MSIIHISDIASGSVLCTKRNEKIKIHEIIPTAREYSAHS